jgi:mannose-6-phosphate isomerase-like protein (cupin superfamily)
MRQEVVEAAGGRDYDWGSDHIYVKTAADRTGGRVTVVEDTLKPGFHLAPHYHKQTMEVFYVLDGEMTFAFDAETVAATRGMTVNIPPNVVHEVRSERGGKLITIFSPGGFDRYLERLASLSAAQSEDAAFMRSLAEEYDTWAA